MKLVNRSNRYFSTFASGMQPVIGEWLKRSLGDVAIEEMMDGLVIYSTSSPPDKIKRIDFFNNSFWLVRVFQGKGVRIEKMMAEILVGERERFEKMIESGGSKFKLRQQLHVLISGKKAGIYKLVK